MRLDLRIAAATLMGLSLSSAMAQATQPSAKAVSAPASAPSAVAANRAAINGAGYRSAFDGYRRYSDQAVGSWREANELVGRIGGWQAYAREGQGGAASRASAPSSAPASAPAASTPHGGHSEQKKQ